MQVVYERCCGLDVHKRMVMACVLAGQERTIRSFGTMTEDLESLAAWFGSGWRDACRHGEHRRLLETRPQSNWWSSMRIT
jgi:hypothetical protein